MKKKTESLKQASYKLAEEIYKAQGAQAGAGAGAAGANPGAGAGDSGANAGSSNAGSKFDKGSADDVQYEVHDDK